MKIIHCADLHLDSKLSAHLDSSKEKIKRADLLNSFVDMVNYAKKDGINSIIIAGDLYDKKKLSLDAKSKILDTINLSPNITFYYLKGNHDSESLLGELESIPNNLKLFDEGWTKYQIGENVVISGIELTKDNINDYTSNMNLDPRNINIVVLHGQENETRNDDNTIVISLKDLRNKHIDYLALGHIHSHKYIPLDSRGYYCYSGCLEPRGFDEIGEHGFVVLDIDENNKEINHSFVKVTPNHDVKLVKVDVSEAANVSDIFETIKQTFEDETITTNDIVKVELIGECDYDESNNINVDIIQRSLESMCYALEVEDKTNTKIDYDAYENSASLKGEFVRLVKELEGVPEEDKAKIIRYGIQALRGEEIE